MNKISCLFLLATVLLVKCVSVPGGFEILNVNKNSKILRIAKNAVDEYNNQTKKKYSLLNITSAAVKIVQGEMYQINATIVETNCKKNQCKNLDCSFLVVVTSWEKNDKFNYPRLDCYKIKE
jgi:hypothetical protein